MPATPVPASHPYSIGFWCQTLNCTETRLRNAIQAVGPLAADVRGYLNR